jgi:hypothetical protein
MYPAAHAIVFAAAGQLGAQCPNLDGALSEHHALRVILAAGKKTHCR